MSNSARVKITLACTEWGDRMNQIVFIGKGYKKEDIRKKLDQCIVAW